MYSLGVWQNIHVRIPNPPQLRMGIIGELPKSQVELQGSGSVAAFLGSHWGHWQGCPGHQTAAQVLGLWAASRLCI